MASLLCVDKVQYECSCGNYESLCRLFFCRHCLSMRCAECAAHEIDSTFCPSCLENVPSGEARIKRNRCASCMQCPVCSMTLVVRSNTQTESTGDTKLFYLQCNNCRWTTRDANIADQTTPTSAWPSITNPNEPMLERVHKQLKSLAAIEKTDRDRKKFSKRRTNTMGIFSDRHGLQAIYNRRRIGVAMAVDKVESIGEDVIVDATDVIAPLDSSVFSSVSIIGAQMDQRLNHFLTPIISNVSTLYPIHKHLVQCDHNLCKGEYSPSSIKFKLQVFAMLHVPEFRLLQLPILEPNRKCSVRLTITNLSPALMHITILPNPHIQDDRKYVQMDFPIAEIILPHRDEAAELDDATDAVTYTDASLVIFRKRHKVGIELFVTPTVVEGKVWMSFIVKYDYVNTITTAESNKEPEIVWLNQLVHINIGNVNESSI